jgi:hypothetical protein
MALAITSLVPDRPKHHTDAFCLNDKGATRAPLRTVAEWTGLEPATSGVTGQHSNRLNYHSAFFWWVL